MNKLKDFLQRHGYLIIIGLILVSVSMLFFSVVNYEIREAIYQGGERISKTDFGYKMNLISYFTTTFHLNFTMYITLGLFLFSIVFIVLGKFVKKQLYAVSALFFSYSLSSLFTTLLVSKGKISSQIFLYIKNHLIYFYYIKRFLFSYIHYFICKIYDCL